MINEKDGWDLINSDNRLWNTAETKDLGGGKVEKTITLPWGIGEVSVTLEGMNSAQGKRNAFGAYGEYIRGLVKERTDDEAITSRAKAAAARAEQASGADSVRSGPGVGEDAAVQASTDEAAVPAHEANAGDDADLRASLVTRRAALLARIERVESDLARWRRDVRGIDAALAAMGDDDAPEDSGETREGSEGESESTSGEAEGVEATTT